MEDFLRVYVCPICGSIVTRTNARGIIKQECSHCSTKMEFSSSTGVLILKHDVEENRNRDNFRILRCVKCNALIMQTLDTIDRCLIKCHKCKTEYSISTNDDTVEMSFKLKR